MIGGLAAAALIASIAPSGTDREPSSGRLLTAGGYVTEVGDDAGYWFAFETGERRFRLPQSDGAEDYALASLIEQAQQTGAALRVRYDATAGEAGADLPYVVFPVCSLWVGDEQPIGDEAANCPPSSGSAEGVRARLALGVGIAFDRPEEARALLGESLSADGLPAHLRVLALRVRGRAAEILARRRPRASPDHDRLVAEALADYRRWVALAPEDADAHLAVARGLAGLGGYDEAIAVLAAFGRARPDFAFPAIIKIAGLYRDRGDHRRALRTIDDFAKREGYFERGMRFQYNRARTLLMLGRDSEAAEAVGRGLVSQPDYAWAYLLRSCARARLGRLPAALADQQRALALMARLPPQDEPELAEDIARSRALVETLRGAVAAGRREPLPAGCEGFWKRGPGTRPRSPLLDRPA